MLVYYWPWLLDWVIIIIIKCKFVLADKVLQGDFHLKLDVNIGSLSIKARCLNLPNPEYYVRYFGSLHVMDVNMYKPAKSWILCKVKYSLNAFNATNTPYVYILAVAVHT